MKNLTLYVQHLDCENEAAAIDRGLRATKGVRDVKVYAKAAKVDVAFDPSGVTADALVARLASLGFPERRRGEDEGPPALLKNPKVLASSASGVLLAGGWLVGLAGAPSRISSVVYVLSAVVGGYFFALEAGEKLVIRRRVGIELLMSAAAIVAVVLGHASEGAMLAFLYSISEAAEGYTEAKTRSAIKALMKLAPKTALVRRGGAETEIPVEELGVDDVFLVRPGQSVATDGVVTAGSSSVDQSPVTGESVPVEKAPGSRVFAGTINGEGLLEVRATKTFADNTIARIIHMVEEAQEKKGKSQRFIERFGDRYSPAVLLIGLAIALAGPLLLGAAWGTWLTRATVFIVAAAPCALVISVPITLVATLGTGARRGVLIKGGVFVEELAKITVVALDKTGTLTKGRPEVTDVLTTPAGATDASGVLRLITVAAGIERFSQHPIAKAIVDHAGAHGVAPASATEFRSLTGAGVVARVDGALMYVGSPAFFERDRAMPPGAWSEPIRRLEEAGKTVVLIGAADEILGAIAVRDAVRPNARRAVERLRTEGIRRVVMLTGDNERAARAIGAEVGVDEVYASLSPDEKAERVRTLAQSSGHVAMVGDGVNDAPALAAATIGVAMGAAGTDVALETADVALMSDDLEMLVYGLSLARRNRRVVRQNLALSAVVIGALSVGALLGWFTLPLAVLVHEVSEFVVIASGLRMLRS